MDGGRLSSGIRLTILTFDRHIFTGYGAYCYIIWGAHLRHILNGDHQKYEMIWPRVYRLPELVRKPRSKVVANGQKTNGFHK